MRRSYCERQAYLFNADHGNSQWMQNVGIATFAAIVLCASTAISKSTAGPIPYHPALTWVSKPAVMPVMPEDFFFFFLFV